MHAPLQTMFHAIEAMAVVMTLTVEFPGEMPMIG